MWARVLNFLLRPGMAGTHTHTRTSTSASVLPTCICVCASWQLPTSGFLWWPFFLACKRRTAKWLIKNFVNLRLCSTSSFCSSTFLRLFHTPLAICMYIRCLNYGFLKSLKRWNVIFLGKSFTDLNCVRNKYNTLKWVKINYKKHNSSFLNGKSFTACFPKPWVDIKL